MKVTFCALWCALFFALFIPGPAWSQTAEELESLLNSPSLNYAQAARFVLEAADTVIIDDPAVAFRFASERKWLPKKASADSFARLDGISLLLMRSFGMEGGFFFSVFKNSHYAYRELAYREIIQGRTKKRAPADRPEIPVIRR